MEVRKRRSKINTVLVFLLFLSLIQCTPKAQIIKEEEGVVLRKRVQEYWNCRLKGEWDKSYSYESPDFREKVDLVKYINRNGRSTVRVEEFDILELWASRDEGYVKLRTKYRYLVPALQKKAQFEREVEERWIKRDGNWYRLSGAG